jgi:signal transduction histidine kinase/ActR/RegA family two-component response regulator
MTVELPTPAVIFWGPDHTQIYNDGYAVIMGPRHPQYFGGALRECWPETYPVVIPWLRRILDEGGHVEVARTAIMVTRHGFLEEAYFTFTLSPLRDDEGRIAGVYQPVVEMTELVLRERRAETLRALTARQEALADATHAFEGNAADIPLAAICTWSEGRLRVAAHAGFANDDDCEARLLPISQALHDAFAEQTCFEVDVEMEAAKPHWPEPVRRMFLVPLRRSNTSEPIGVAAYGLSPRLRFDASYRDFFNAVSREIATNLAAQRAEHAEQAWRERERATRRDAEAAEEAQARRLAKLFEHAPVGIAVLRGPDHVFEVANSLYAELLPGHELLNRPIRQAFPELAGQGIYELLKQVYDTGEPFLGRSIRLIVVGDDGRPEERFFDFAYQAMPGDDGKTDSIIVVVFEVTELSRARRDAEAANRAKDEFFAILGHELRNPLAPITTALQLMRLRGDTMLEKERTIIERQVTQITRLVDDLLDVSRITRGKVTLKLEPIEIAEVVAKAIEMASPILEQKRHHLEIGVPPRGLVVDGDAVRLTQILTNLLNNAAKYTEPGGVVCVTAQGQAGHVQLSVADTGVGIAAEMLPHIFEPFAQEQQTLDRAQGGLGLGLTIVANLVKLHGGSVSVRSKGRGHGSTFTVQLPLSDERLSPSSHPSVPVAEPHPDGAFRVLVVDDNEDAAEMLAEAVRMLGCATRVAHDGAEALRIAEEFTPHVGLLDIGLPVMDGYEVATRLRSAPGGDGLHLVAVTGYGQDSDRKRTAEAGFDAHLVKPIDIDAVANLVERYRAQEAAK